MNLLSDYKIATKSIARLEKEQEGIVYVAETKKSDIQFKYREKIYELERERNNVIETISKEAKERTDTLETEVKQLSVVVDEVQRILRFQEIFKTGIHKSTPEVYYYSDRDPQGNYLPNKRKVLIAPVKSLIDDKYNTFNLYIVPNGKPVNKFSLVIRGYTIFGDILNNHRFGYVRSISETNCNVSMGVKDALSERALFEYMNRPQNMKKIMELLPQDLNKLGEEYEKAVKLLEQKEWQIFYLQDKKSYYENHYSHGTETPEYAEILKALKILKS